MAFKFQVFASQNYSAQFIDDIIFSIQALKKHFDQDIDGLIKQHKQLIEKAEQTQQNDLKNAAKKLRSEQVHFSPIQDY